MTYRIVTLERDGEWLARAERTDNGDRFGIECAGPSAAEAAARLARWLEWQQQHVAALEALQQAEHTYHRTITGDAFASSTERPERTRKSLDALEAARVRLDEVRERRPR
jgi:hypothetical protein